MNTFSLLNKTRGKVPPIPFRKMKESVLGSSYDLSVALVPLGESRALSKRAARKNHPSNVLAFPFSKRHGEIVLCPAQARVQAKAYGMDAGEFIAYLFIHGMLHLKGRRHGATMEGEEQSLMKRFGFHTR